MKCFMHARRYHAASSMSGTAVPLHARRRLHVRTGSSMCVRTGSPCRTSRTGRPAACACIPCIPHLLMAGRHDALTAPSHMHGAHALFTVAPKPPWPAALCMQPGCHGKCGGRACLWMCMLCMMLDVHVCARDMGPSREARGRHLQVSEYSTCGCQPVAAAALMHAAVTGGLP